jgi:hypothetical protein
LCLIAEHPDRDLRWGACSNSSDLKWVRTDIVLHKVPCSLFNYLLWVGRSGF